MNADHTAACIHAHAYARNHKRLYSVHDVCRVTTDVAVCRLQAFCLYGATRLTVDDTDEAFIPDGSYLIDTNNARDK